MSVEGRKQRSDKKYQVAPTISTSLKDAIEKLAFITDQPVKNIGALLVYEAIHTRDVVECVVPFFQRGSLLIENSLYYGHEDNTSLKDVLDDSPKERISIRFNQVDAKDIQLMADLLMVSHSLTVAALLGLSIKHHEVIDHIVKNYNNRKHSTEEVSIEMRKLMRYVNKNNPYTTTWSQRMVELARETKQIFKGVSKKLDKKSIDTETYRWDFD